MLAYIVRRLLALPVVMLLVTAILFAMILMLPAEQRVMVYIPSVNPHLTEEQMQELIQHEIERHGLDRPFVVQYVRWLSDLVSGDWGYSPTWRQPVLEGLLRRVPATLELSLFAFVPSMALAVALGTLAVRYRGRLPDHLVRGAAAASWAFPPFVLGLILMNVFYAWLHWFPPERLSIWATFAVREPGFCTFTGLYTVDALLNLDTELFLDAVRHLVLPATTLALTQWALFTRVMRSSLLRVMGEDYVVMAQAKGLTDRNVMRRHARRTASSSEARCGPETRRCRSWKRSRSVDRASRRSGLPRRSADWPDPGLRSWS